MRAHGLPWDVRESQPHRAEIFPAQFPQNPSGPTKFPHFSRKRGLLKFFVHKNDFCKLSTGTTLTR